MSRGKSVIRVECNKQRQAVTEKHIVCQTKKDIASNSISMKRYFLFNQSMYKIEMIHVISPTNNNAFITDTKNSYSRTLPDITALALSTELPSLLIISAFFRKG